MHYQPEDAYVPGKQRTISDVECERFSAKSFAQFAPSNSVESSAMQLNGLMSISFNLSYNFHLGRPIFGQKHT